MSTGEYKLSFDVMTVDLKVAAFCRSCSGGYEIECQIELPCNYNVLLDIITDASCYYVILRYNLVSLIFFITLRMAFIYFTILTILYSKKKKRKKKEKKLARG